MNFSLTRLREILPQLDLILFDVDGVLLDTSRSFPLAIVRAVRDYGRYVLGVSWRPPRLREVAAFKEVPGFNNDWDLVKGCLLFFLQQTFRPHPAALSQFLEEVSALGGGLQGCEKWLSGLPAPERNAVASRYHPPAIQQLAMEHYAGKEYCFRFYGVEPQYGVQEGTLVFERPLADLKKLRRLTQQLGIYTGRNPGELEVALEKIGFSGWNPEIIFLDDGNTPKKPDPEPLLAAARRTQARALLFVGDTYDDFQTVQNLKSAAPDLPAVFVQVRNDARTAVFGAVPVVSHVNELLDFLVSETAADR